MHSYVLQQKYILLFQLFFSYGIIVIALENGSNKPNANSWKGKFHIDHNQNIWLKPNSFEIVKKFWTLAVPRNIYIYIYIYIYIHTHTHLYIW